MSDILVGVLVSEVPVGAPELVVQVGSPTSGVHVGVSGPVTPSEGPFRSSLRWTLGVVFRTVLEICLTDHFQKGLFHTDVSKIIQG